MIVTADLLKQIPLFSVLDHSTRRQLAGSMRPLSVPGGWTLFRRGEPGDSLFVVISGALGVFAEDGDGTLLARIFAGETVGEMALVSNKPRSATVKALRDSTLLEVTRPVFETALADHPQAMMHLVGVLADRLRSSGERAANAQVATTFALVALSPSIDPLALAYVLRVHMADQVGCNPNDIEILDEGLGHSAMEESRLHDVEVSSPIVLYCARDANSNWADLCRRRADHVVLLADAAQTELPTPRSLPSLRQEWRRRDLVIVGDRPPAFSPAAEQHRLACELQLRVAHFSDNQVRRLARFLTRSAIGVVLAGGGARGFSEIGIIQALREAHVPIDLLGGTSMGALIAACFAMGWDTRETTERLRETFVTTSPTNDYTLPLVSLIRGEKVSSRLRHHFGATNLIEDLPVPFYSVAANLTTGTTFVHRTGTVWEALRASVAIPGLIPPVVTDHGVLVDGGILNNLPVDVMANMQRGPVVAVEVSPDLSKLFDPRAYRTGSRVRSLLGIESTVPGIVATLLRAGTLSSEAQGEIARQQADLLFHPPLPGVDLLDWKSMDHCIRLGYEHARQQIDKGALDALVRPRREPANVTTTIAAPVHP